ncbi:Scr1 family TA system antitoxin-like transcriptional regulator [Streptomyces buecherae]|uniref:Scr1 family TA system antitoxin-like transcriptional regulator n=1 Tax=Streptomyces buecherae TaxID=2763006 RepID=UPI00340CC270
MVPPDLPVKLDAAFGTDGLFGKLYELARKEVHPDRYRRRRQALLRAEPPPELSIILAETVLRRVVGGFAVMREQLATLLPLVDGPATVIQVMSFSHGAHALLGGSLTLMTL